MDKYFKQDKTNQKIIEVTKESALKSISNCYNNSFRDCKQ